MLRILAFSDVVYPDGSGGVERHVLEVYGRIVRTGKADVRIVTLAGDRCRPGITEQEGMGVHRASRLPFERITGAQTAVSLGVWRVAREQVRDFRPHVVHANTLFHWTSLVATWVARRTQLPLVVTAHLGSVDGLSQPYRALTTVYERTVGRAVLAQAAQVICVGEAVGEHIVTLGVPRHRIRVVPNGVDTTRFVPGDQRTGREPVVLSVGRLIFNKGIGTLIEAATRLYGRGHRFRLVVVGTGPLERRLREQAASLRRVGAVSFLGHRDDVPELLRHADLFVRPSLTEGMPMAVLEAMAAGLPVIATDVGSTAEIVRNDESGLLIAPGSVDELESALEKLLANETLRRTMGTKARLVAVEYDWERVALRTLEVLTTAAGH